MIVNCPSCDARYRFPDGAVGEKGRRVQCASCNHIWLHTPEAGNFKIDLLTEPQAGRGFSTAATTEENSVKIVLSGFLVTLLVLAAFAVFMILARQSLVQEWPILTGFYEHMGFPLVVQEPGFAIENLTTQLIPEDHPEKLQVKGVLVNKTEHDQVLPSLLIRAMDEKTWLKDWKVDLYGKTLSARQSMDFDYVLTDIPQNITKITIRFAE